MYVCIVLYIRTYCIALYVRTYVRIYLYVAVQSEMIVEGYSLMASIKTEPLDFTK